MICYLLQKIYGQPLKKIAYLATRPRFLAQGQSQGLAAVKVKAKTKYFGLKASRLYIPDFNYRVPKTRHFIFDDNSVRSRITIILAHLLRRLLSQIIRHRKFV